jgi:chromosome segregation ATPase
VTQFKETDAFEELQKKVSIQIAGVILARLKEIGVPDEKLEQVSDDICEDLVAEMFEIGQYEVPGAEVYAAELQAMVNDIAVLKTKIREMTELEAKVEAKDKEMAGLEARVKAEDEEIAALKVKVEAKDREIAALDTKIREMISQSAIAREISGLEDRIKEVSLKDESTDSIVTEKDRVEKIVLKNEETEDQVPPPDTSILSLDKVLSILKAVKSATK